MSSFKKGDYVRVKAEGHAHNEKVGTILRVVEGDMPHVEVKQSPLVEERVHVEHYCAFDDISPHKEDTELVQGNVGEMFADIVFDDGSVYKYADFQLEEY